MSKKTILVIAAHPDDEVLGCGGTISRMVKEGNEFFIAILGEGITSRFNRREDADEQLMKKLQEQCRRVGDLFGVKKLFIHNFPDNRFDTIPLLEIVKFIEDVVDKVKPRAIFTHHGGDLNIDHAITFKAAMTAARPIQGCSVKEIYTFESPSATDWSFGKFQGGFNPNYFIDITETIEVKLKGLEIYEEELRSFPHPRSLQTCKALAQYRGSTVGLMYAEAFEIIRKIQ